MLSRNAPWLMKKNYLERTRLISYRFAVISTTLSVFYQIVQKLIRPCNFSDNSNQPDFRVFYKPSFLKCTRTTVNYISRNQHLAENRVLNGYIVRKKNSYPNGYNFQNLQPPKLLETAVSTFCNQQKLISRKIRVAENQQNFLIVKLKHQCCTPFHLFAHHSVEISRLLYHSDFT